MASPVREHRSPQRYSLSADQTRRLGAFLERHGGISTVRLNRFSADFGCARKTIHQQVERLGYQVSRVSRPRSDPSPPGNGLDNCLDDPRGPPEISAAAEAGSGDGAGPKANSDPAPLDEEIAILAAEEVRLRDEHDCRERDFLQSIAELEGRIRDREARLEEDRAAVRKYMEATKRLRVATRQDRDTIDTLSDENTVLKMRNRRLESEMEKCRAANGAVKAEIRTSLKRERRLLSELRRVGGLSGSE